ncbi:hypothetical protein MAM1_0036d02662 [Mucor ambiguus]|uniref:Uncharacterized protein n=1 Tax=Mucor ambiguus TaxID=91626 RepID=A0A0C9M2Z6_9FUNG|nr:hypothetical protein MAM1_0036d02662 [Mucor ambiguus]
MVNVTTFMVATTAMLLGINALDVKAAEQIKMGLEDAQVIPASASAHAAAAASSSVSDVYKAAVESVLVQAAVVKAENNKNGETRMAADSIFNDIIADFGKFIDSLLHPSIDLPSVDLPDVALPSVELPSVNVGLGVSVGDASSVSSVIKPTPKPTPKASLKHNKRAIYDMDGSYSESSASISETSNEYSAQDFPAASASASASAAYYMPHAASVKAVLKARRSEAYASASSAWASASASASASAEEAAISAAPEMWDQVMVRRSADADVSEEEDQIYSKAQFGFDLGDLIGDRIKDEIGKKIQSEIGKNIQSEIGKNIASAIKSIPKTSIDFDALRSSLLKQFSSGSSNSAEESSSVKLPSISLPAPSANKTPSPAPTTSASKH